MARQVTVEILGNAKQYIAATEEANLASTRLGGGLGHASGAAKNLEKDLTGMGKSMAGNIPVVGGFGSALGGIPLPALAAVAAIGLLVAAGKSIIEISDRAESSQKSLAQATASQGVSLDKARQFADTFIQTNKKYIETQTDVIDGYASLTRSGLKQHEVQRDLNIAIDLAALKHISLVDAVDLVNKAEHGRMRGLVDLGIVTKSQTDADGNLIGGTKNVAAAMDKVEQATAGGRDTLSDMKKATNDLGGTWQTFATKNGPGFTKFLSGALGVASAMADAIGGILQKSLDLQNWIGDHTGIGRAPTPTQGHWASQGRGGAMVWVPGTTPTYSGGPGGRASGGPVSPGNVYTVGEAGPELFSPSMAGTIIPHGAGGITALHIHIDQGAYIDGPSIDRLTTLILQRARFAPGF